MSIVSYPDKNPALPKKKDTDYPEKIQPNPDDPNEQKGPPMREMPIVNETHHKEILDTDSK
ncbi:MAG: hypothetical protein LAT57_07365 [Balneolales bacterium]|nr:hypothetical protein [Balneolales bacterium]